MSSNNSHTRYCERVDCFIKGVADGIYPGQVYKYRPDTTRTLDIIRDAALWFAEPSSFNDPFDCNLSETPNHAQADFDNFIARLDISENEKATLVQLLRSDPKKARDIAVEKRNKAIDARGVLTLSRNYDNLLLWAHYSDNHKGLVLGFDVLMDPEFFMWPLNVSYQDTYKAINYFRDGDEAINKIISTKSAHWAYEEEFRVLKKSSKAWPFQRESLTDIYFGCRSSNEFVESVIQECSASEMSHVRFHKAELKHGMFGLDFQQVRDLANGSGSNKFRSVSKS